MDRGGGNRIEAICDNRLGKARRGINLAVGLKLNNAELCIYVKGESALEQPFHGRIIGNHIVICNTFLFFLPQLRICQSLIKFHNN